MKEFCDALGIVFKKPQYILLAFVVVALIMLLAVWLPNLGLVWDTVLSTSLSFGQKLSLLGATLGGFITNFTPLARVTTVLIAVLFGVHVSMVTYYLVNRITLQRSAGIGALGIISGLIGIGCAACGSVILSALVGVGAAAGVVGVLPFHGQEFSIISILIILVSLVIVAKKITNPLVCKVG